ncbi:glycosyltransferase family 2 protein [Pseudomonas fulva]|uniref:glycosyltransferase family 2 protein n=1 Tax=Pseudomonas fulva TaxID=47880 RepID=UPI0024800F60|nr:glycosyltransferase family 2 protein [Pseudomonas fulva]
MNFSSQAKAAFNAGNYELASNLYLKAMSAHPELAGTYLITLNLARGKMGLSPMSRHEAHLISSLKNPAHSLLQTALHNLSNLNSIYKFVNAHSPLKVDVSPPHLELVSVVVIAKDCERTVEESITSILRQSWSCIELIIVDNASSDRTWEIIQRIENTVSSITSLQLHTDHSGQAALDAGLSIANGQFIFFQNAKDFCHPHRIEICMHHFNQTDALGLFGMHCLVSVPSNNLLRYDSNLDSNKFTSIAFKRELISQIGSLEELPTERFDSFLLPGVCESNNQATCFHNVGLPLYFQAVPDVSSIQMTALGNNSLHISSSRAGSILPEPNQLANSVGSSVRLGSSTTVSKPGCLPVVASVCSVPQRVELLYQAVKSLAPQVDFLHVYLDNYNTIPTFLYDSHPQLTIYRSSDYPDLRDNGKFLAFPNLPEKCYYFTADDDIIYPPDYVASMINRIDYYDRQVVIGVHGVLLPEQAQGYFSSFRKVHTFNKALERDALVNNLGTGTVAFHSDLLHDLNLTHFTTPGMADLHLSVFCKERSIPMIAIARIENWLQELPSPNTSLYHEFRQADYKQSALIRAHQPWGYAAIKQAVEKTSMRVTNPESGERLQRLIPILHACLK